MIHTPPPSLVPDFSQLMAIALPLMLAAAALGVLVMAVLHHHAGRGEVRDKTRAPEKKPPVKVVFIRDREARR